MENIKQFAGFAIKAKIQLFCFYCKFPDLSNSFTSLNEIFRFNRGQFFLNDFHRIMQVSIILANCFSIINSMKLCKNEI